MKVYNVFIHTSRGNIFNDCVEAKSAKEALEIVMIEYALNKPMSIGKRGSIRIANTGNAYAEIDVYDNKETNKLDNVIFYELEEAVLR